MFFGCRFMYKFIYVIVTSLLSWYSVVRLEITSFETRLVPFLPAIVKLYKIYVVCVKLHPYQPRKFSFKIIVPFQRYCSFCSGVFYFAAPCICLIFLLHSLPCSELSLMRLTLHLAASWLTIDPSSEPWCMYPSLVGWSLACKKLFITKFLFSFRLVNVLCMLIDISLYV